MKTKITVIMGCYNCENFMENSINSVINQTIGFENIELMLIDDGSTDNTKKIINKYKKKYDNIIPIFLEKNSGGPSKPRNIGIEKAKSDYIMFLDSDDRFKPNTCELLYNKIKSSKNIDLVFGRYLRIFDDTIQKSYSPYEDNIDEYHDDILAGFNQPKLTKFIWTHFISKVMYANKINLETEKGIDEDVYIKSISENPEILKILPSIWTKIYKKDIIKNNNINFKPFYIGEDLNFLIEYYLNCENILFLNNDIVYEYYIRNSSNSVTKNTSFKAVFDTLKSYFECCKLCNNSNLKCVSNILLNPFLLNFINVYSKFNGTIEENESLLNKTKEMDSIYASKIRGKILFIIIILKIRFSIFKLNLN
jgi:glycosyltransferase involved in cell wall biosynthesis